MSVLRRKISGQRNGFFRYRLARSHSVSPFLTTCFTSRVESEVTTRLFVVSARAVVSVGFCAEAELATPAENASAVMSLRALRPDLVAIVDDGVVKFLLTRAPGL